MILDRMWTRLINWYNKYSCLFYNWEKIIIMIIIYEGQSLLLHLSSKKKKRIQSQWENPPRLLISQGHGDEEKTQIPDSEVSILPIFCSPDKGDIHKDQSGKANDNKANNRKRKLFVPIQTLTSDLKQIENTNWLNIVLRFFYVYAYFIINIIFSTFQENQKLF